jgi:ribosomal protein L22
MEQEVITKTEELKEKITEKEKVVETPKEVKEKKEEKVTKKKQTPKKDEATVNVDGVPISTKYSMAICKFIKWKRIDRAIEDLEKVIVMKKIVPMRGEIPHRKGKGIMSGRWPVTAAKEFVILLKSLKSNANANGIEDPVIVEAIANMGFRPHGRFGRVRKKRTIINLKAIEFKKMKLEDKR